MAIKICNAPYTQRINRGFPTSIGSN